MAKIQMCYDMLYFFGIIIENTLVDKFLTASRAFSSCRVSED